MEQYQLVIAEKPSVAQALAAVLGAKKKQDGYLEGNGWLVSWCVGHLVELAQPGAYDEKYAKWRYDDLPILPASWKYQVTLDYLQSLYEKKLATYPRTDSQYITADIFGPPVNRRAAFFMPKYLVFISVRPKTGIYALSFSLFLPVKNRF